MQFVHINVTKNHLCGDMVDSHPLNGAKVAPPRISKQRKDVSQLKPKVVTEFLDPLQAMNASPPLTETLKDDIIEPEDNFCQESQDVWRKSMNLLIDGSESNENMIAIPLPLQETLMGKLRKNFTIHSAEARLEWLESGQNDNNSGGEGVVTPHEFVTFIEVCNQHLSTCWKDDHRVKVVQTVIQLAKMLETPIDGLVFFLVTDSISFFGKLVYDRLVSKSPQLRINFKYDDVSPQARELCKNWFYKIASVRELIPRFYLETAMLKCYKFSCDLAGFDAILERLTLMIRGFGGLMSAAFARMYLTHVTATTLGSIKPDVVRQTAQHNYEEMLNSFSPATIKDQRQLELPLAHLIRLQTFGLSETSMEFASVLRRCFNQFDPNRGVPLTFTLLLKACPPSVLKSDLTRISHVVGSIKCEGAAFGQMMKAFLQTVCRSQNLAQDQKSKVLDNCWTLLCQRFQQLTMSDFFECVRWLVECWMHPVPFYGKVNSILANIMNFPSKDGNGRLISQSHLDQTTKHQIQELLTTIISSSVQCDSSQDILSDPSDFILLMECLDHKQQVEIAMSALKDHPKTSNKELVFRFARILASSVNALTIADEVRQISQLICRAIDSIDNDPQPEKRLKFYTECRATFRRMDSILTRLVHLTLNLAIAAKTGTKKREGFPQACIAFVFVTIPSLSSSLHQRLLLYQLTSQVAFQCRCIGQAEACIVALLRDLGAASGNDEGLILSDFLPSFISYTCTLSFDKESEFTQSTLVKATLKVSVPLAKQSSGNQQLSLIKLYIKAMTSLVSSSHSEDFQMCMDLITLVQARLDFLFAQDHLRSVGCMGAVKLYHWLKNHTKEAALLNEIRDIIEANAFDMDKETTTLWRRLSIE